MRCVLLAFVVLSAAAIAAADNNPKGCPPFSQLPNCRRFTNVYNATSHCFLCQACSIANQSACQANVASTPSCNGTQPFTTSNCCQSCIVRGNVNKPSCSEDQEKACEDSLSSLPVCAAGANPVFNSSTCCVNCRPPPRDDQKPSSSGRCTRDAMETCINTTQACSGTERPVPVQGSCCPSCIPSYLTDDKAEAARCATLPPCADGQDPQETGGACRSCRRVWTCDPACGADQVCHPTRNGTTICVKKFCPSFRMDINDTATSEARAAFVNLTCVEKCGLLKVMIQQFCVGTGAQEANQANAPNRCTRLQAVVDAWECASNETAPTCTPLDGSASRIKFCLSDPDVPAVAVQPSAFAPDVFSRVALFGANQDSVATLAASASTDPASGGYPSTLDGAAANVAASVLSMAVTMCWAFAAIVRV